MVYTIEEYTRHNGHADRRRMERGGTMSERTSPRQFHEASGVED